MSEKSLTGVATMRKAKNTRSSVTSFGVVLLTAVCGCASQGSEFATGGTTGTASGGAMGSIGGTTGIGSGGDNGNGSGGSFPSSTGGSTFSGSGGNTSTGSGGASAAGTGGTAAGSGGASGSAGPSPGTGGASIGNGGRSGSGGSVAGTGGRIGTGGATGTGGSAMMAACPKPAGQICHEFYAADNSANRILYVNEFDPSKNWTAAVNDTTEHSPRTLEIVDNPAAMTGKALLVSTNRGFGEYDVVNGANLFRVLNQSAPVTGAARIPNPANPAMQQTALGIVSNIVIVTNTGARVSSFTLPNGTDELRVINRNPADGTYWFSKLDDIFQVSATGAMLWTANLGTSAKGYAVWWREGGGAYATTGDPSSVVTFDAAKTQLPPVGTRARYPELNFASGFVRLPNGNFVMANWLGHLSDDDQSLASRPHLVELTPQNAMVWKWGTQAQARRITNVNVIR